MAGFTWRALVATVGLGAALSVGEAGAQDVRPIPPPGVEITATERQELEEGRAQLTKLREAVEAHADENIRAYWPDVAIFERALATALKHDEFFDKGDIAAARRILAAGVARGAALTRGETDWAVKPGLTVRGYVSRIDGSVQPYGLVIPDSYAADGERLHRLDLWLHGRDDKLNEIKFIDQRLRDKGQFTPPDTLVLHPYGRYCNAFKFAGEVDVLEGLKAARGAYRVDPDRVAVRGFSMGGAGCWHLAVHHADRWFASNPGAGFVDTIGYQNFSPADVAALSDYQRKLFHLYDCPDWAANLRHVPTLAYSGEIDKQKLAADTMERAAAQEGLKLTHIVGPQTAHKIHADSAKLIEQKLESLAEQGRQRVPRALQMVTYTLKYNRMHWVRVDRLNEHWLAARVEARLENPAKIHLATENVRALTIALPADDALFAGEGPITIAIDGQTLDAPRAALDGRWNCALHREGKAWRLGPAPSEGLFKRHDLQGPIDDALMDSFIFVRPTGKSSQPAVAAWAESELARAIDQWRRQFRGEARVKNDTEITAEDIASANLILFGDPQSNAVLARLADKLPIKWSDREITVGDQRFSAAEHAAILIYPNPLNPRRYVVLNSGFTFREADYLTNSRQVARLPDWAIVDLREPPSTSAPGKIAVADFFDEAWKLKP